MKINFDLSGGNIWGRAVYSAGVEADGKMPVTGCLMPLPKVGDVILAKDGSYWLFTEVTPWNNPPDGFQGEIERAEEK